MKTILIGYDATDPAERALERAAQLAAAFGSQVIVTSVTPVLLPAGRGMAGPDPTSPPELHQKELGDARRRLQEHGVKPELVLGIGDPPRTILQLAEERGADLIVLGTRQLGALARVMGQSVSEEVLRRAPCDVLLVR
jgi:nucleotide-binding universal stress UspA family protein